MSKIRIPRSLIFFGLFAAGVLSSDGAVAQSKSFSGLAESDHGGMVLYFYPSTVRVILKMTVGEKAAETFKTVKRGRVVFASAGNAKLAEEIRKITSEDNDEGFKMLMQLTNAGTSVSVMKKEGKKPMTLFFMADEETQYAVEIEGEITPQMLMQLMSADVGAAAAQFGIGPSAIREEAKESEDIPEFDDRQNHPEDE